MSGHRIVETGRAPYPDGSVRVLFRCAVDDCVEGHVEATPGEVADVMVAKLAAEHDGTGVLLGGLVEVAGREWTPPQAQHLTALAGGASSGP